MAHSSVEPPKYIHASQVKEVLKYEDLIPVIEEALVNFSARESGGVVQPVRTAVQVEDSGYKLNVPVKLKLQLPPPPPPRGITRQLTVHCARGGGNLNVSLEGFGI